MAGKEAGSLQDRVLQCMAERDGMTPKQLEFLSGVSQQTINLLVNGKVNETTKIVQISRALGVWPDWLFDGQGPKNRKDPKLWNPKISMDAFLFTVNYLETISGTVSPARKLAMFESCVNHKSGRDEPQDEHETLLALIRAFQGASE